MITITDSAKNDNRNRILWNIHIRNKKKKIIKWIYKGVFHFRLITISLYLAIILRFEFHLIFSFYIQMHNTGHDTSTSIRWNYNGIDNDIDYVLSETMLILLIEMWIKQLLIIFFVCACGCCCCCCCCWNFSTS